MTRNYGVVSFLCLAAGILSAALLNLSPLFYLLGLMGAFGAAVIGVVINRRRFLPGLIAVALVCGGGFWLALHREAYRHELLHNRRSNDRLVTVGGVVIERPVAGWNGWRFTIAVRSGKKAALQGRIVIFCNTVSSGWYGQCFQLTGKYKNGSGVPRGFPESDERRGAAGRIYLSEPPRLIDKNGLPAPFQWADRFRTLLMRTAGRYLNRENAVLLQAMIFGAALGNDRAARRLQTNLRRTGAIHLLSVSGLHIGFVVAGFSLLLGLGKVPRRFRLVPLGLTIGFYILMTGMEAPVLRAGLMTLIYLCGQLLQIRDSAVNRLGLAAAFLLIGNPYDLFEIGYQLSVVATLGVVWLAPLLGNPFRKTKGLRKLVGESLRVSLAAQIMVLPALVFYFQQISWCSPVVNLLLLAPAWLAVVGGLCAAGIGVLLPAAAPWLFHPVAVCLELIRGIAAFWGGQPWAAGWSPVWPWPWIAGYYLALLLFVERLQPNLISGQRTKLNWGRAACGVLLAANLLLWSGWYAAIQPKYLELVMLDVGQGDSFLLRTPDGKTALVDGGPPGRGRYRVLPFLRAHGIARLNLIIVTHGHSDHLSGIVEVLDEIPTAEIIAYPSTAALLRQRLGSPLPIVKYQPGQTLHLGRHVGIRIWQAPNQETENNRSLVAMVNFAKNKLLLTGDLERRGEAILERQNPVLLRAGILKIGHHGSDYASGLPWLTRVRPRVALISVGAGNRFGHPGAATLNRLHSLGVKVYRTDTAGNVAIRLYPEKAVVMIQKAN